MARHQAGRKLLAPHVPLPGQPISASLRNPTTALVHSRGREFAQREAQSGLRVHAVVTVLLWALVIALNVTVASGFPWSVFVILGSGIGLFFHWLGAHRATEDTRRRQETIAQYVSTH
jgi:hypothetical protein